MGGGETMAAHFLVCTSVIRSSSQWTDCQYSGDVPFFPTLASTGCDHHLLRKILKSCCLVAVDCEWEAAVVLRADIDCNLPP